MYKYEFQHRLSLCRRVAWHNAQSDDVGGGSGGRRRYRQPRMPVLSGRVLMKLPYGFIFPVPKSEKKNEIQVYLCKYILAYFYRESIKMNVPCASARLTFAYAA